MGLDNNSDLEAINQRLKQEIEDRKRAETTSLKMMEDANAAQRALQEAHDELEKRVTERTRELIQSEKKMRAQYRGVPIPTFTWQRCNNDFVLIDYNDAANKFSNGGAAQFIGKKLSTLYADRPDIQFDVSQCFFNKTPIEKEIYYNLRASQISKYIAVKYAFVPEDLVMVHAEDINDRKLAEVAMRQSEERLAEAQRIAGIGYWILDAPDKLTWSEQIYSIFGIDSDVPASFDVFYDVAHEDDRARIQLAVHQAFKGIIGPDMEFRIRRPSGEIRTVVATTKVTHGRNPLPMFGTLQDITERKRIEERTQELLTQNRNLTQRLFNAQEEERRHLAIELHDDFGQWLTALQAHAELLSCANPPSSTQIRDSAKKISSITAQMQYEMRTLIHRLRPHLLDELGLIDSLHELVGQWESNHTHAKCSLAINAEFNNLGENLSILIYRVVQESLTNVAKHSGACKVEIILEFTNFKDSRNGLSISIKDNGKGLYPNDTNKGFGLLGMRERVIAANGKFSIQEAKKGGTHIHVTLPFSSVKD